MNQGDRRRMKVLLSVLGVLVAAFLMKTFVLDSGSDESKSASSRVGPVPTVAPTSPTTEDPTATVPPEEFNVNAVRDPFEPAIPLPTSPSSSDSTDTTDPTDTTATTGGGGGSSTSLNGSSTPTTASNNPSGLAVSLLQVFVDTDGLPKATVQIGTEVFESVTNGDMFGPGGKFGVVSLDVATGCGEFLYGDSPFPLCQGQQTLK